jgi:hypothetical protein
VPPLLDKWKHTEALGVSDLLTTALGRLPVPLTVGALSGMLTGVDLVATNVPGPASRTSTHSPRPPGRRSTPLWSPWPDEPPWA